MFQSYISCLLLVFRTFHVLFRALLTSLMYPVYSGKTCIDERGFLNSSILFLRKESEDGANGLPTFLITIETRFCSHIWSFTDPRWLELYFLQNVLWLGLWAQNLPLLGQGNRMSWPQDFDKLRDGDWWEPAGSVLHYFFITYYFLLY